MPSTFQILFDGSPADDDFYSQVGSVEVEENADMPGAVQITLPVSIANNDLTFVNDDRFRPFANIAVTASADGTSTECIFDGLVLSQKLHLDRGAVSSRLEVWGQDTSWLMNLEEKAVEWADVTDSDVAGTIFGQYGVTPSSENSNDDSPAHTEDGNTLMQRGTDIMFLRSLARASGKWCRVFCTDTPGQRTGYFARPKLDGDAVVTLDLNDINAATTGPLDLNWDVARPTAASARQVLLSDVDAGADVSDSGLAPLDERDLTTFAGKTTSVMIATPAASAGELNLRAQGLLADSGWVVRCSGESDVARLNAILRVGSIVAIQNVGSLHSGKYLVWSVRHTIAGDSHRMHFVLVRNAVGPEASSSGLGGLLGGLL
jgi:hypothetical protein